MRSVLQDYHKHKYLYFMISPVVVFYVLFHYVPMYGAIIAFKDYRVAEGFLSSPWVGFQHFTTFFESFYFWRLLKNTLLLNLYSLVFTFPAPILFALLINEIGGRFFKKALQSITYLPHFISLIVICGMINQFVAREGVIMDILVWFGMDRTSLLSHPEFFRVIYITSDIWQSVGWGSIIYLAAITGINPELYEASRADGAGKWRQTLNITLPGIAPIIIILFILKIGHMLDVGFEKIILLYNPNTYETADVISTFVYRKGLGDSFEFSYATAVGLFQSALNFMLLITANKISRRLGESSLW
ncbi:ABC transporter permease subunit [Paenibacillus oryzisoli]|uniref:ABC transporter permease n=1 Tax=Paenibacillus oryzisoli TaxID=1850517 RepID=UPI003D26C41C